MQMNKQVDRMRLIRRILFLQPLIIIIVLDDLYVVFISKWRSYGSAVN